MATGAKLATIDLPSPAFHVAIDPAATRAYVATMAGLTVVDLQTNTVVTTVATGGSDVAVDPAGKRVYLADGVNKVALVDTATNTSGGGISVGAQPRAVVVSPDGTRAFTGNTQMSPYSVSLVDLTTDMQTSELFSGNFERPENLGILPTGAKVYAANFGAGSGGTTVAVLNTATNGITLVTVGSTPIAAAANPAGTKVYVANRDSMSISVIDAASSTVVDTIPLTVAPTSLAVAPDGNRAVITTSDFQVAILDLGTRSVISGPIPVDGARAVAIAPAQTPVPAVTVAANSPGQPSTLNASASTGGPAARYDWDFGDGATAPNGGPSVTHVYSAVGTFQAKLTETNDCDPAAVFGPLGVSFAGHTAFCKGDRTATRTVPVAVPAKPAARLAVAVVRTRRAKVGRNGVVRIKVACIKQLDCSGTVALRTARKLATGRRRKARVALGSKRFRAIRAGRSRTLKVKLSRRALGLLGARGTLAATATVSVPNPSGGPSRRTRNVKLTR